MTAVSPSRYLWCKYRVVFRCFKPQIWPPWQAKRSMAQVQRRRPSRLTLSPNVAVPESAGGRKRGRQNGGPFGSMNKKSVGPREAMRSQLSEQSQPSRSHPGKKPLQKERETFHALKMHKALSEVSYGQRKAVKSSIERLDSFEDFALLPHIRQSIGQQVLPGMVELSPTPIQSLAIPALLGNESRAVRRQSTRTGKKSMEQFLLAAETGSGKTLAYVLPILDAIKRAEMNDAEEKMSHEQHAKNNRGREELDPAGDAPNDDTARPRAIILLPTSELVTQVGGVIKLLAHTIKFRSVLISSAYSAKVIRNRLFSTSGIDVLISTPHLLASISESEPNVLSRVSHLVIDEADSLFDRSFAPSTSTIVDKSSPTLKQLILCSATVPRSLDSYLRNRFPNIRRLVTPKLHAIPRRVQLGLVDIDKQPYIGNRLLACADTIWSIGKAANENRVEEKNEGGISRLLVFVNERETTKVVADFLVSKGIDAVALNRDAPEQRQAEALQDFTNPTPTSKGQESGDGEFHASLSERLRQAKRHLPNTRVLVSTDLASRGIDTLAVRHVILHDVPHTTVDFIHRLGRAGRMGRRGRGIVLVGKKDRKDVVREVREGMFKGQALI